MAATLTQSRKGRPVIRIAVVGVPLPHHYRGDSFSVKLRHEQMLGAQELVQYVNAEVEIRHRWRQAADSREVVPKTAGNLIAPADWHARAPHQRRA